jgi:hypothetical protein
MRHMQILLGTLVLGLMLHGVAQPASAQDSAERPSTTHAGAGAEGERFQSLLRDFERWAAVQKTYDEEQIKSFRSKLIERAARLTGMDYDLFLEDFDSRLQVLLGAEARAARDWFESMDAVSAPKRMEKIKSKLPDVAHMTADEIKEQLDEFDRRLRAQQEQYSNFKGDRRRAIDQGRADRDRQEEASRTAREAASHGSIDLGANEAVNAKEKQRWTPRPPVYSRYNPYSPNLGNAYAPYVAPSLRSVYSPNLGGYRW